ncbi:hypothetical protein N7456_008641 [Penicillium angulare]|uniref:Uncharacterized protein n=1 Tax=Penicillium angulare TaxID=116970 RepID=A0A9W9F361_9EURO|nr:hypothetical protein N7456_008641 [Penicillium angulare]
MYTNWVILGLAALVATSQAFLPQNQLCGSNKECSSHCQDGEFHIMSDGNNTAPYFACKQAVKPYYQATYCTLNSDFRKHIGRGPCEAAGGRLRVVDGSEFCDLLLADVDKYHKACEQANGKPHNIGGQKQMG